ncbi:MAG: hypothetical protein A2Y72_06765 [Chloroflexi bacterium RBG_13_53_26]|nr:MAG: hypothetical protein A2Y72_06765 [Chloroflexi bacterium RBG_13_53_26]
MGEIKSAWEIAMEKAEKLGRLSPEEFKRQRRQELDPVGQGLADRYLGGLGLWQLRVELDRYKGEEKTLVTEALISGLVQGIELGNNERLVKIIEGISGLRENESPGIREIEGEVGTLFQEYQEVEQKERRKIEDSVRGILHQLRISGSAIGGINPKVMPEWQQALDAFAEPYATRLEELKERLRSLSQSNAGDS